MNVVIATTSAVVTLNGERHAVTAGRAYLATDRVVRQYPDLFTTDERAAATTEPVVEQATAAPGEKRGTRRRA